MSTTMTTKPDFQTVIQERHSVRQYDPSVKIPREEMEAILKDATLAPSSSNLQPWRFLVIDDADLLKKLHPIANNQEHVLQASAVIAVLGDLKWYEKGEKIYSMSEEAGYMTEEVKQRFIHTAENMYANLDPSIKESIVDVDAGLISMQLMLSARARGYDTVPMGGYNKVRFVEEFHIPSHYRSVMLIAIGKAAAPGRPTVRLPLEDVAFWNEI
ncbi:MULTISPECIES: nitroreductase family protein [Paenibacillus]|uniref:nitroreductase family protein n=1 Tax=Paenibacillus TaxID=44249 RepID=UPI000207290C|nr:MULTISPECIES: nitroreductase family protein [Paenibacillus]EGG34798.1 nitroreductase family protein [Paenibacillus sp. HGF5]MCM3258364.1 nitroreductase family protein [Paenibacillus lautus]